MDTNIISHGYLSGIIRVSLPTYITTVMKPSVAAETSSHTSRENDKELTRLKKTVYAQEMAGRRPTSKGRKVERA